MALKKIIMPKVSQELDEVTIVSWSVKGGDLVKKGDVLLSVETEKTTVDVESEYAGTIVRLLAGNGDVVKLFAEIAEIESTD